MCLQAEEATVLAQTQVQELEVQDEDNTSANELSWDDCLHKEQANIYDTSQGVDELELNLFFSARIITMSVNPLAQGTSGCKVTCLGILEGTPKPVPCNQQSRH